MAESIPNKSEARKQSLDNYQKEFESQVIRPEIQGDEDIKKSLTLLRKELEDLKNKTEDDAAYIEGRKKFLASASLLQGEAKAKTELLQKKVSEEANILQKRLSTLSSLEEAIQKIPPGIKDVAVVKIQIETVQKAIRETRDDMTQYEPNKTKFSQFRDFFTEKIPLIQKQSASIDPYEKNLKNIPEDIKKDSRVKPLLDKTLNIITQLKGQLGNDDFDISSLETQYHEILSPLVNQIDWLLKRQKAFEQFQKQAREFIGSKGPDSAKILYDFFGFDKDNISDKEKLATSLAQMMLEGDGLSLEQILKFADNNKDKKDKTASDEVIQKWIQEIGQQNPEGKVKGTEIQGEMPLDMQEAIKDQLRGPNTLKMMQVASARYQVELNDYLNGVNNEKPLSELGFNNDEWFANDAGEKLGLTKQEAKLVFLEEYTSTLAEVIKMATNNEKPKEFTDWIKSLWSFFSSGENWVWKVGGGALLLLLGYFVGKSLMKKAGDTTANVLVGSLKGGGKFLLERLNTLRMVESNYDSMINETTGQLNADARNYVLGNIKLIQARMHLNQGQTLEFEGDTYGPLSKEEGESRIKAIETAVGSATLTNPNPATPNTISKGMRDTRFKITQANKTNTQASQDSTMNKALIRFIQNMSRTEQGLSSLVLKPNSRYLNQNGAGIVGAGVLRTSEAIVPAVLGFAVSPLAGAGGLLALPSIRRTVVGGLIRTFPSQMSGFWVDKKGGRRSHTFQGVNDEHKMVRRVGQALLENSDIKKHTEYLTVKGIGGEFLILKGNTDVFNTPSEIKLLDDLERAVKDAGGIEESTWKFTITRLGFICRGKGAVNGDEAVGFPGVAPVVPGADPLEALKAAALQYGTLNATEQKELNALYEQIFTGKKADGTTATLTSEQIIKCGELTRSRVVLPGTVGENGILDGAGRDAMNKLEKSYYEDNTYADAATFDVAYGKWFSDHAKQCSNTYDAKKHLRLLNTQKKLLDFMDDKGAYAQELKDGKKSKVDVDILKKIKSFVDPDAVIADETQFTNTFRAQYAKKLAKLQEIAKSTSGEIARQIASIDTIDNEMNTGTIKNRRDYETKMRAALNAITVDEVLFDYVNNRSGISPAPTFTSRVDAIDGFCADRVVKYISKMNTLRANIISSSDWKTKLDALAKYRKYEDSDQTALDGVDSVALVHQAYSDIYVTINALTEPVQIEEAYKKLKEINPESNVSTERVPYSKHLTYISDLEQKVTTLRGAAKREISKLFSPGNYPDVVGVDGMISKLSDDLDAIRVKYGPRLCTSTEGVDELGEAEAKFVKIQAGHRAAVALSTRIAGGEFRRDADIASAIGNFQSAPAYAEYLTSFQGNFDILVSQAKIDAQNARGVNRSGAPAEPATPPPPPENLPPSPEPPTDTPAAPETAPQEDVAKLKADIAINPLARGVKTRFQRAINQGNDLEKSALANEYISSLKKVSQDTRNTLDDRRKALSSLEDTTIRKVLPLAEYTELTTYINTQRAAIDAFEITVQRRRVEAGQLAEKLSTILQGKSPEDQKVALMTLLDGEEISTGQKEVIRESFPEDSDTAVTQDAITGCVHKMIYVSQEVGGNMGEQIAKAHSLLLADTAVVAQINVKLKAANIANIEATVNDNINIRGR